MQQTAQRRSARLEKLYYAHARCLYGRADEQRELSTIRRKFCRKIVNPAYYKRGPFGWALPPRFYFRLIDGCSVVVFSRCLGKITAGVGKEVNHALTKGKMVFELKAGKLVPRTRKVKYISRKQTRVLSKQYRACCPCSSDTD